MNEQKDAILYTYYNNVYLNITNACPCSCEFCIRRTTDCVGSSGSLWLSHNPTLEDVKAAIDSFDFSGFSEAVFCGYGEPTSSFDVLIGAAQYLRSIDIKTRLNTNGLGCLIQKRDIVKEVCDNIDFISISLNASNAEKYNSIVHPSFGIGSFEAMLDFGRECRKYTENVMFTVVDIIGEEEINECRKVAESVGVPLRVRTYTASYE